MTHPTQLTELFTQFTGYSYSEVDLQYRVDTTLVNISHFFLFPRCYYYLYHYYPNLFISLTQSLISLFSLLYLKETPIAILFSPGNDSPQTGVYLESGEDIEVCGIWELRIKTSHPCNRFCKLMDGRGWIPMISDQGYAFLQPLLQNPLK